MKKFVVKTSAKRSGKKNTDKYLICVGKNF
jgi:hypothetical protein